MACGARTTVAAEGRVPHGRSRLRSLLRWHGLDREPCGVWGIGGGVGASEHYLVLLLCTGKYLYLDLTAVLFHTCPGMLVYETPLHPILDRRLTANRHFTQRKAGARAARAKPKPRSWVLLHAGEGRLWKELTTDPAWAFTQPAALTLLRLLAVDTFCRCCIEIKSAGDFMRPRLASLKAKRARRNREPRINRIACK